MSANAETKLRPPFAKNGSRHFLRLYNDIPKEILSTGPAQSLARAWITAWNNRDIPGLAALYSVKCQLTSPAVVTIMNQPDGVLTGIVQHATFWSRLFERSEIVSCELYGVFRSVESTVIHYRSCLGKTAMEFVILDSAGLIRGSVTHFDQF